LDLDAWRGDLQRLHGTIDQVVQSFISSQTRQLDAVAAEIASQQERILLKEQSFAELSDSIAGFVEAEAQRMEACGLSLHDPESDARHEAYDAELPGPPVLHRINRLWRKASRAFEAARSANEREAALALEAQRKTFEARVAEADRRCEDLREVHRAEQAALEAKLEASLGDGQQKDETIRTLTAEASELLGRLESAQEDVAQKVAQLEQREVVRSRCQYEWDAEREDLSGKLQSASGRADKLERLVEEARERERELVKNCSSKTGQLEQMRRIMDEQEKELNQKIERVQHYVKERQAGALHAEQKQKDAERMAERWQSEVRRLQAEKDRLAKVVFDLEGSKSGQASQLNGAMEKHQQEVASLQEALRRKEEEMRAANLELLQQRDREYQAKVEVEKQREKDRSIALLRKKEQEAHIKDQQLKAARQRIQELEGCAAANDAGRGAGAVSAAPHGAAPGQVASPSGSSQGSSAISRRDNALPPLPLSAR